MTIHFNRIFRLSLCALALTSLIAEATELNIGDSLPAFSATDDSGKTFKSDELIGDGTTVFYFYPAAMTPGCTKQACSYRDAREDLMKNGIRVYGISGDTPEGLKLFRKAHNLNFPLLSDSDGKIASVFGVPQRAGSTITREIEGKTETLTRGTTASRWTFAVNAAGKIIYRNTNVNPTKDVEAVLELIKTEK